MFQFGLHHFSFATSTSCPKTDIARVQQTPRDIVVYKPPYGDFIQPWPIRITYCHTHTASSHCTRLHWLGRTYRNCKPAFGVASRLRAWYRKLTNCNPLPPISSDHCFLSTNQAAWDFTFATCYWSFLNVNGSCNVGMTNVQRKDDCNWRVAVFKTETTSWPL